MKNTLIKNKRQPPKHARTQLDACFLFQPEESFKKKLTPAEFKTFNRLLWYASKYDVVFPSQGTIAKEIGYTRQTVNEAIARLIHYGLILKIQRWKTWTYAISAWFNSSKTRRRLAFLFPILAIGLPAIIKNEESITTFKSNPTVTTSNNIDLRVTRSTTSLKSYLFINEANCENIQCARVHTHVRSTTKKRETVMSTSITPAIDTLTFLTLAGKIEAAGFPDSIIQLAADNIVQKRDIQNPFLYFMKLCKVYAAECAIAFDYKTVSELKTAHGIGDNTERNIPNAYTIFCEEAKRKSVNKLATNHRTPPRSGTQPYSGYIPPEELEKIQRFYANGSKPKPNTTTPEQIRENVRLNEERKRLEEKKRSQSNEWQLAGSFTDFINTLKLADEKS